MNVAASTTVLDALLVDDDPEVLNQCKELLPKQIDSHEIYWDFCSSFEDATNRLRVRRYDIVLTDVYRDRKGEKKKGLSEADNAAKEILAEVKQIRFCPIVLFSDGTAPTTIINEPFVRFVDKANQNFHGLLTTHIKELLETGIMQVVRQLHADLDKSTGSYIWGFIEANWETLNRQHGFDKDVLSRLVRRRTATQLSRLREDADFRDRDTSDAFDYYTYPTPNGSLQLGEVIRHKVTKDFYILLTPHCYLAEQNSGGTVIPAKADFVLIAKCIDAVTQIQANIQANAAEKKLAGAIRIPAAIGKPVGRYCYLPAFLEIPDLYCDLLQINSVPLSEISTNYNRIAVIDSPFAEAMQASMVKLYSSVGLRDLRPTDFQRLLPPKV